MIPVELNPIGLIKIFPVNKSLLTFTNDEVPIPTERFGLTSKSIVSSFDSWWEVDTETVELIFSTFPMICGYRLSNEYFSLLASFWFTVRKYTSEEFRLVFIPITFLFLLLTYTGEFVGILNVDDVGEVEIAISPPGKLTVGGILNITDWLWVNGWFSI